MKYNQKIKFCKDINTNPIYETYSHGIICCCYKDSIGDERLQVMHLAFHSQLISKPCNDWAEDYMLEWIINATKELKDRLNLTDYEV